MPGRTRSNSAMGVSRKRSVSASKTSKKKVVSSKKKSKVVSGIMQKGSGYETEESEEEEVLASQDKSIFDDQNSSPLFVAATTIKPSSNDSHNEIFNTSYTTIKRILQDNTKVISKNFTGLVSTPASNLSLGNAVFVVHEGSIFIYVVDGLTRKNVIFILVTSGNKVSLNKSITLNTNVLCFALTISSLNYFNSLTNRLTVHDISEIVPFGEMGNLVNSNLSVQKRRNPTIEILDDVDELSTKAETTESIIMALSEQLADGSSKKYNTQGIFSKKSLAIISRDPAVVKKGLPAVYNMLFASTSDITKFWQERWLPAGIQPFHLYSLANDFSSVSFERFGWLPNSIGLKNAIIECRKQYHLENRIINELKFNANCIQNNVEYFEKGLIQYFMTIHGMIYPIDAVLVAFKQIIAQAVECAKLSDKGPSDAATGKVCLFLADVVMREVNIAFLDFVAYPAIDQLVASLKNIPEVHSGTENHVELFAIRFGGVIGHKSNGATAAGGKKGGEVSESADKKVIVDDGLSASQRKNLKKKEKKSRNVGSKQVDVEVKTGRVCVLFMSTKGCHFKSCTFDHRDPANSDEEASLKMLLSTRKLSRHEQASCEVGSKGLEFRCISAQTLDAGVSEVDADVVKVSGSFRFDDTCLGGHNYEKRSTSNAQNICLVGHNSPVNVMSENDGNVGISCSDICTSTDLCFNSKNTCSLLEHNSKYKKTKVMSLVGSDLNTCSLVEHNSTCQLAKVVVPLPLFTSSKSSARCVKSNGWLSNDTIVVNENCSLSGKSSTDLLANALILNKSYGGNDSVQKQFKSGDSRFMQNNNSESINELLDDLNSLMVSMHAQLIPINSAIEFNGISSDQIDQWMQDALFLTEHDVKFDGVLLALDENVIFENDKLLLNSKFTLERVLRDSIQPLLSTEQSLSRVKEVFHDFPLKQKLFDVLRVGARKFMKSSWKPNGGKEVSINVNGSYAKNWVVCNHSFQKLVQEGKAIVFTADALDESNQSQFTHQSDSVWVPKVGSGGLGRTCLNASRGSKNYESVNDGVDLAKSDQFYPPQINPMMQDICQLISDKQAQYPGEQLSGGVIDVSGAWNQIVSTPEVAMITSTVAWIPRTSLHKASKNKYVKVVVVYLVGMFGDTRAGFRYGICGQAIDYLNNRMQPTKRSGTYVDDTMLIDPLRFLKPSMHECIESINVLFGPKGVNDKKVKVWQDSLEGIGWIFDLISMTVRPNPKGVAKLFILLMKSVPMGSKSVHEKLLERLIGVIVWYAVAIPCGVSFVLSLYDCQNGKRFGINNDQVPLSKLAQSDLMWWRSLIMLFHVNPVAWSASIESVKRNPVPNIFMTTDASKLIGGGAWLSYTHKGTSSFSSSDDAIRWTRAESDAFMIMNISINVLEYFVMVYYVMLWVEKFKNQVVHIECDNTSAIAWIMKSRIKGSLSGDVLAKIFSLFCLRNNITTICIHISGVNNILADFKSRDLNFLSQDADEKTMVGTWSDNMTRQESCRKLLLLCVTRPEIIHGQFLLKILTHLHSTHG